MYVTTSCRSGADLYRLTTRISESQESASDDDKTRLGTVLAPLGIEILRAELAVDPCPGSDLSGPHTSVAVINLTMPIDLPAIDYLLRASGHEVLDLRPDDLPGDANQLQLTAV